jgi:uncharacterized protein (DUF4213/DUF364 family)
MVSIVKRLVNQVADKAALAKSVDIVAGRHWTLIVLEDEDGIRGGLASALDDRSDHHHGGGPPVKDAGRLLDYPVPDLLNLSLSSSAPEASIGFATLNALLDVDMRLCREVNALDVIMEHGSGRDVAVVGHFPFVPRLEKVARTLWVLERNPQGDDLPASQATDVLPRADVVALTGTSLANGTFDKLITCCRRDAFVVVLGATTPLSPVLLDTGVNAIAGTVVEDVKSVKLAVSQGATFRQIRGKRLLVMEERKKRFP